MHLSLTRIQFRSLPVLSAADLCKEFGSKSGPTKHLALSGSKLFDSLIVFLNIFFKKVDFEKNQQTTKYHEKLPSIERLNQTTA